MFATIKSLIPEPRQVDQPRRYVGRHRGPETLDLPDVDGATDVGELTSPEEIDTSAADVAETVSADAGSPNPVA